MPTAQVQVINTTETSVQGSGNAGGAAASTILSNLSGSTGLKTTQLFVFSQNTTPGAALNSIQQGKTVMTSSDVPGFNSDSIASTAQLAEMGAVREMPAQTGISPAVGHAFHALEGNGFSLSQNGQRLDGYQGLDAVNHGKPITVTHGGQTYTISTAQEAVELNALQGDGQNNPLSSDASNLLQVMASKTPGAGFTQNGRSLDAFGALQALHRGQPVQYSMTGGAFGDTLSRPLSNLSQLPDLHQRVMNQQEKDRFRPSIGDFQTAAGPLTAQLPAQTKANVAAIQGQISTATQHSQADQAEISRLSADMKGASNNQAFNNGAVIVSNILSPDDNNDLGNTLLRTGSAVDQAQINDDAVKITHIQSDMVGVQQQMIMASGQLPLALQAQNQVATYQKLMAGATTDAAFDSTQPQIQATLSILGNGAVDPGLQQNLQRQTRLMTNMQKPTAPAGWQAPSDLFE
jgi:hypothetical protein